MGLRSMAKTASSARSLHVVLVSTRNPLNIGAAARAVSNFGFSDLRVVNPHDRAFREARSAVGASELLQRAQEFRSVRAAIADCSLVVGTTAARHRKLVHPLRSLYEGANLIRSELGSGQVALLFGSEKRGLSNDDLSLCRWLMRIPTREEHPSMNLGQAVAVCLYELSREQKHLNPPPPRPAPTSVELDRLTNLLLEALEVSGYARANDISFKRKVRRLITRPSLSADDIQVWLGMLRQMLWKMRSKD
jgi:TrmH family RNA methyltransferase